MSWIGSLVGKAETVLNFVDQAAGQALQRDPVDQRAYPLQWTYHNQSFDEYVSTANPAQNSIIGVNRQVSLSASVPVNLNRLNEENVPSSPQSFQKAASPSKPPASIERSPQTAAAAVAAGKKDKDEELFEFLNTPDLSLTSSCKVSSVSKNLGSSDKIVPGKAPSSVNQLDVGFPVDKDKHTVSREFSKANNPDISLRTNVDVVDTQQVHLETNESGMEQENKMLKKEINVLTQELNSIIRRNQEAQDELQTIRQQLTDKLWTGKNTEELQARLADMQEALATKDTQLAILKVRLEEVNRELDSSRRSVDQLQAETRRLLHNQSSAAGSGEHSCEVLEAKQADIESQLRKEQALHRQIQEETMEKLNTLESDKQRLCSEVGRIQRFYEEEKGRNSELQSQLKVAKSLAETAKQDLSDYKDKAMRILQSKERLITSLKDGSLSSLSNTEQMVSSTEMEAVRQERDMIREELHHTRMALETAKLEITELEMQLQQDQSLLQKRIESLEEQIVIEKKRRQEVEEETANHKQEIGKLQGELQKQTTALLSRIDDRDEEIHRLRNQVTMKSLSGSSQDELEGRLHTLTESLIQKQTILESLSTEKNSLVLQLERMEKHYREAEAEAIRTSAALAGAQDHQEARHRLPGLLRESATDGEIARQVKHAANVLDRFSIRLGLFLRRYPIARVFVILYMALLHFWVFVVLMTYQQEIHKSFLPPQPPPNSQ